MISESTKFLAHPNEIKPTEMGNVSFCVLLTRRRIMQEGKRKGNLSEKQTSFSFAVECFPPVAVLRRYTLNSKIAEQTRILNHTGVS